MFLGLERPGLKDSVASDAKNLELRWGGALEKLSKLADGSVRIVNADFLFTEYYSSDGNRMPRWPKWMKSPNATSAGGPAALY
ncbi:MAG: hypothetical protein V1875_09005 [Candidatus Altiarchaeota archaeon]